MHICIFEDQRYSNFLPLAYFRPVYELRCGVLTLREKLESHFPRTKTILHVRSELSDLLAQEYSDTVINMLPDDDVWFVNGRLLVCDDTLDLIRKQRTGSRVYQQGDDVAAAFVKRADFRKITMSGLPNIISASTFAGAPTEQCSGTLMNYLWDVVNRTAEEIQKDFRTVVKSRRSTATSSGRFSGVHLLDKKNILIGKHSVIKPGAVLDATEGPIVIGENVVVMSNAVIQGPVYIGDHSIIKVGAKIYHGTSIGRHCKVGGEVEASVIQSYSNKQHDGFLGHSYLGSWINIGADTNNSDLKNTYGTVKVYVDGTLIDSHMQFVGLLMGDHSKTGINTMINTGTVVGISCNIYGANFPPKVVPSFSWGEQGAFTEYGLDQSLTTARRMMARRNIELTPVYERVFRNIFSLTKHERRTARIA